MKRSLIDSSVGVLVAIAAFLVVGGASRLAAGAEQDALQADHAFMQALATLDKAAVSALLDADLVWTDATGKTLDKAAIVANLPASAASDEGAKSYTYGSVVTVRNDVGKLHVLRVWTKRTAGWRLLVYHEVKQAEKPAGGPPAPPVKECVNPCKALPYTPQNASEAGVITSWQQLETAVTAGDGEAWAPHFADEFVVISSGATDVVTKAGRIAALRAQKEAGTNGAPAGLAPGHTKMLTIGDTVVMNCQTLPHRGKPAHITRVWIKRGATWLMTVSLQTTIVDAAPVAEK
ncbi:MAG: nuclear transport factor 2 family protein [Acidobacteriota bacterium]